MINGRELHLVAVGNILSSSLHEHMHTIEREACMKTYDLFMCSAIQRLRYESYDDVLQYRHSMSTWVMSKNPPT